MSTAKQYLARLGVKSFSSVDPVYSDGRIGDMHCNQLTGEIWTKVDTDIWRGSQNHVVAPITSYANADLVAAYDMADVVGATLNDKSANNNDATVTGAVQVAGLLEYALSFDGSDDHVSGASPLLPATGDWAIAQWVNIPSLANDFWLYNQYLSGNSTRLVISYDASPAANFDISYGGASIVSSSASVSIDTWIFVVTQRNGGNLEISVDNESFVGAAFSSSNVILQTAPEFFGTLDGASFSSGKTGPFRLFDRALTNTEIGLLYNNGVGV